MLLGEVRCGGACGKVVVAVVVGIGVGGEGLGVEACEGRDVATDSCRSL